MSTGPQSFNPVELIKKKRNGEKLSDDEIRFFIQGAAGGRIPEYQVSALLMAIYFQGMDFQEASVLTSAMIASGRRVQFTDGKPKIDKHSTGGIGDKVSLILAPLVACLGVDVPMVSGRGLGHTGGTLDKLESIPGFRVNLSIEEFIGLVEKHGMAMMGQTADFVPADKLLYALRDVTGTVESVPLITASILSKKVAEGINGLVLDIKVGSGAFMKTQKDAEKLARSLVGVGSKLGLKIRAILTDMNQPLGSAVGHSLEVLECIDILQGKGPADLRTVTIELAAQMLLLAKKTKSVPAARKLCEAALDDGRALAKFGEMCRIQGATADVVENPSFLKVSPYTLEVGASRSGFIKAVDGEAIGMLLVRLGGGRKTKADTIDYGVGFQIHGRIGDRVQKGSRLATLYFNPDKLSHEGLTTDQVVEELQNAFSISKKALGKAAKSGVRLIKKVIE